MTHRRGTALLELIVYLLLVIGLASAQFQLSVVVPDDPDYAMTYASATLTGIKEIVSVSSPVPNLISGYETGAKNRIAIKGVTPNCKLPLVVIGKKPDGSTVRYTGNVHVTPVRPDDVKQAVTVAGDTDKLNELITELKKTYGVVVVSQEPATSGKPATVSLVLKDKATGKTIPKAEAERIIEEMLKNIKGPEIQRPDCYTTCKEACGSVLVMDTSSVALKPAEVTSETGTFYSTLKTKLEHRCGKDYYKDIGGVGGGVCVASSTCSNGGTCRTGDSGTSPHICSCKKATNEVYGPTCQLLTRSYLSTGSSSSAITHHSISSGNTYTHRLDLAFQHSGKCTLTSGSLCTILKLEVGGKELLKVQQGRSIEPHYTSATLPATPAGDSKMGFYADRFVENQRWMDVTVAVEFSGGNFKASTIFCSKEVAASCVEQTTSGSIAASTVQQAKGELSIGGTFNGCFRNVRVNGRLVDLQPDRVTGDAALTKENCAGQTDSCGGASGHTCGADSVCYGQLGAKTAPMNCGCRCTNDKRMTNERITMSTQCAISCSKDTPIVSTGASGGTMSWAMNGGSPISVPSGGAPFTVLLRFRTRQTSAPDMLRIEMAGSGVTATLKIESEVLNFCLGSSCYPFVPALANDGRWHEVFVSLAHSQLVTRLDEHVRVHSKVTPVGVTGVKVSMSLPSSCISNIRVSDIYMPTSDSDSTHDSTSAKVKASVGSGATAGATCKDPSPGCSCDTSTEDCVSQWGGQSCTCKSGFKRPPGGSTCQAPSGNPCTRMSITCPNVGGTCVKSGNKWLVCQD